MADEEDFVEGFVSPLGTDLPAEVEWVAAGVVVVRERAPELGGLAVGALLLVEDLLAEAGGLAVTTVVERSTKKSTSTTCCEKCMVEKE